MNDLYLIWSLEHHAWWRPNSCGYTNCFQEAGIYTKADAERICENANAFGETHEEMRPIAYYSDRLLGGDWVKYFKVVPR